MCQRISKFDVALSLDQLTGKGYENTLMDLKRFDKPKAFSPWGGFDTQRFAGLARSGGASDLEITKEVSRLTSKSFESSLMDLSMIPLKLLR